MNALLVIVMLSNQGNWIAGTEGIVRVQSVLQNPGKAGIPPCDFVWELSLDGLPLAAGKSPLDPAGGETVVKIVCPEVRTRVPLRLAWRMTTRDGRELSTGVAAVDAFPADLTHRWADLLGRRRLLVVDPEGSLSKRLVSASVLHVRLRETSRLQVERAAIVLVAPDALTGSWFEQAPLLALARSGAGVMVLRQTRVESLAGYPLARRAKPRAFFWNENHPLLDGFTPADSVRWLEGWPADLIALRLPESAAVNSLIKWPAEAQGGASPAETIGSAKVRALGKAANSAQAGLSDDALLVVQPIGLGRLVLCQLPLGDWETDPRSQLFLGAALDYLTTRPEPLARPALTSPRPLDPQRWSLPIVPIRSGDRP